TSEEAYGVYWPALVPQDVIEEVVVTDDGRRLPVGPRPTGGGTTIEVSPPELPPPPQGPTVRVPLGLVFGARSGDKGGNANVGVWARSDRGYAWLAHFLTVERFKQLIPEARELRVDRIDLPNLRALNFVVHGLLGEGVAASTRQDPQAKSLGEYLRAKYVEMPAVLLADVPAPAT
ncbi:MAG: exopolyphosphatase, partial [Dehalococcoidia bacterium]|nr:exopolyphosphatase [Dehalococcoidia bacterium]